MNARVSYVLVGLFVLLLSAAFVGGILWFGAGKPGQAYETYLVYLDESVAGLSRDSAVKYNGVDVGLVRQIRLSPRNPREVKLVLAIEKGTPIYVDTVATLTSQGLTGLAYLDLSGGSPDSPLLRARKGEKYPVIQSRRSLWSRLDKTVSELAKNLIQSSKNVNELLNEENRRHVAATLEHVARLSELLLRQSGKLGAMTDRLSQTLTNLQRASQRLPTLLARAEKAAASLDMMAAKVGSASAAVESSVTARSHELHLLFQETGPDLQLLLEELTRAAGHLRRFSEMLERDPAILLQGRPPSPFGPGEK